LIDNGINVKELINGKLSDKITGKFTPFDLEVAPGRFVSIVNIQQLVTDGEHADVYKCTLASEEVYALKIFKTIDTAPAQAISFTANQLYLYSRNLENLILKEHTARFENFDPHLDAIKGMNLKQVSEYVKKSVHQGFSFVPFIPDPFPLDFDESASLWIQLKELFASTKKAGLYNDLRRANVGILDGKVVLFDLYEHVPGWLDIPDDIELLSSFTDDPKAQKWLVKDEI